MAMKFGEFAKSRAMRASVPTWFTWQRAWVPAWFACQRACVPTSHFYVPTCQYTCQRAIQRANVLTRRANLPYGVQVFQKSYEMLSDISILYYYITNSTFCLIS